MKPYGRKLIAPIIIAALIVLYLAGFLVISVTTHWLPPWAVVMGIAIPVLSAGVMVYVLIERIKEVRSGEEDDLNQY